MKRILLSVVAVAALALCGAFTNTAEAHGPRCGYRPYTNYGYSNYGAYVTPNYGVSVVPYGAGYIGGYQPYQQMYYQRLYYGAGF